MSDDDSETQAIRHKAVAFSPYERQLLLDLVKQNRDVVESKQSDFSSIKRKKDAWVSITSQFCSDCQTNARTAKQLQKYWSNAKRTAKKELAIKKQALRKTGGGRMVPGVSQETEKITAIILSQLNPLVNGYDCDSDDVKAKGDIATGVDDMSGSNITNSIDEGDNSTSHIIKPDIASGILKNRQRKEHRSSLFDMEYEEHRVRMRTLMLQQETETLKRNTARRQFEMMEEEHALKMRILSKELLSGSDPKSQDVQYILPTEP